MKIFIALFIFLGIIFQNDNQIYYHERPKVSWEDFRAVNKIDGPEAAHIHVAISSAVEYDEGFLNIEIKCYMTPESSLVLKDKECEYLLNHEQRHFDLQEVFARRIRKRYLEKNDYTFDKLQKDLNGIFIEEIKKGTQLQADYDNETNHSIDEKKQSEWNDNIDQWLLNLEDYKDVNLKIKIE